MDSICKEQCKAGLQSQLNGEQQGGAQHIACLQALEPLGCCLLHLPCFQNVPGRFPSHRCCELTPGLTCCPPCTRGPVHADMVMEGVESVRQAYTGLIYGDQLVSHGLSAISICWMDIKRIIQFEEVLLRHGARARASLPSVQDAEPLLTSLPCKHSLTAAIPAAFRQRSLCANKRVVH